MPNTHFLVPSTSIVNPADDVVAPFSLARLVYILCVLLSCFSFSSAFFWVPLAPPSHSCERNEPYSTNERDQEGRKRKVKWLKWMVWVSRRPKLKVRNLHGYWSSGGRLRSCFTSSDMSEGRFAAIHGNLSSLALSKILLKNTLFRSVT